MPRPADSLDDEPYDADPPPDPPSGLMLIGLWALLAPPLTLAVPTVWANTPGGFEALLRVLAGGYVAFAGWALWRWTARYAAAPPTRPRRRPDDEPDDEDEADVWDEDAEAL